MEIPMAERLLVKEEFGDYLVGDRITDARTIKKVVASHPDYVLRETVSGEPEGDAVEDGEPPAAAKPRTTRHTLND
jgi:hypothetical protein